MSISTLITYQDFTRASEGSDEKKRQQVLEIVRAHKESDLYKTAAAAHSYMRGLNPTIAEREHKLLTRSGKVVTDTWSPNNKTKTSIFRRFVNMEAQYLLSNGIRWKNADTEKKLGKEFEESAETAAKLAIAEGVSFGFANFEKTLVFSVREFAPLFDEENGSLRAGVRFYRIDDNHPLLMWLYDENGRTKYVQHTDGRIEQFPTESYILYHKRDGLGHDEIYNGENYENFPIIPCYGNSLHQSELIPLRDKIDAYDFIQNDYINRMEDSQFYWIIRNAGGLDDNEELAKFIDQLRDLRAATLGRNVEVDPVEVHVPYQESEQLLSRLERELYKDAMMTDVENIASGATTATQIDAAYTPLKIKSDELETEMYRWLNGICGVLGIDDEPVLTPDPLINKTEEINNTLSALGAGAVSQEYATERVLTLMGDIDKLPEVIEQMNKTDIERFTGRTDDQNEETPPAE